MVSGSFVFLFFFILVNGNLGVRTETPRHCPCVRARGLTPIIPYFLIVSRSGRRQENFVYPWLCVGENPWLCVGRRIFSVLGCAFQSLAVRRQEYFVCSILDDFWSIFGPFLIDFWLIFGPFFIDFFIPFWTIFEAKKQRSKEAKKQRSKKARARWRVRSSAARWITFS